MRSEKEMYDLILEVARQDERIRAVILNGSRANPKAGKDIFQDYDIVYFVRALASFTKNHHWVDVFGERLIMQMPDQMQLPGDEKNSRDIFAYLMLFADYNRIDLTLFPVVKIRKEFVLDSLSLLLLDKDSLFPALSPPDESGYLIQKPTEKEFLDVCNEFWWVTTYVAKGLWRNQTTYATAMFENPVRKMFLKIIEWHIGLQTNFSVNFGSHGKNLKKLVDPAAYEKILATYSDEKPENIWKSLFLMSEIFAELAGQLAEHFGFNYQNKESLKVIKYLQFVKSLPSGS